MTPEIKEKHLKQVVAIDLDYTLIWISYPKMTGGQDVPVLRPGAIELLQGLRDLRLEIMLYTTASKEWVEIVFNLFPELGVFDQIYHSSNSPRIQKISGVKDPAYIGADIIIDDFIDSDVKARLGHQAIQVPSASETDSTEWAIEALVKIKAML